MAALRNLLACRVKARSGLQALAVQATAAGPYSTAIIVNNGTIDVGATAVAHATGTLGDPATATANVYGGIGQFAHASEGNALVSLTGTGSIDIGAIASAVADNGKAFASASITAAISQSAVAQWRNGLGRPVPGGDRHPRQCLCVRIDRRAG